HKQKEQYFLKTKGNDPYLFLSLLEEKLNNQKVLTFEYKTSVDLDEFQVFLADPIAEERSIKDENMHKAEQWETYSIDLGEKMEELDWCKKEDYLRLDFGTIEGVELEVKNFSLRNRTEEEQEQAKEREDFLANDQKFNDELTKYLKKEYKTMINE